MSRPRTWTDEDLRRAVTGPPPATSLYQVSTRLGLAPVGSNKTIRIHAARLGLTLPNGWYRPRPEWGGGS
jgi:hypothetical protein